MSRLQELVKCGSNACTRKLDGLNLQRRKIDHFLRVPQFRDDVINLADPPSQIGAYTQDSHFRGDNNTRVAAKGRPADIGKDAPIFQKPAGADHSSLIGITETADAQGRLQIALVASIRAKRTMLLVSTITGLGRIVPHSVTEDFCYR